MTSLRSTVDALAKVFVLGEMREEALILRASTAFFEGRKPRWLRPLSKRIESAFGDSVIRPRAKEVAEVIAQSRSFKHSWKEGHVQLEVMQPLEAEMLPGRGAPSEWNVPPATSLVDLAKLLEIHIDDLGWFQYRRTQNYYYKWIPKKNQARGRLIEIPKPLLKETQRCILRKILTKVPVHECAAGFESGSSVHDFVANHTGKKFVLRMDLRDFFPSILSGRVFQFFMTLGYPEVVASALADLCTNDVEDSVLEGSLLDTESRCYFTRRHLPQGAPTSPALANRCAFRLDCRLAGLAKAAGADFSRYADDLLFSGGGDFQRQRDSFHVKVLVIVMEEGFRVHPRKTCFQSASQRQFAAGLVLNQKSNLTRQEFDRLKAILTNCVRHGWESQNHQAHPDFQSHLLGRIGWAEQANPEKAKRLRRLFEQIHWESK